MPYDDSLDEPEWRPEERTALDSLRRERMPNAALRHRTLITLRQERLVWPHKHRAWRGLVYAVAAAVIFAAGGIAGYRLALARTEMRAESAVASGVVRDSGEPRAGSWADSTRHVVWF